MDFNATARRLGDLGVTQEEMGQALGVSRSSVKAALLDPESAGHRRPPDGWEGALSRLARARAAELVALAEELEG